MRARFGAPRTIILFTRVCVAEYAHEFVTSTSIGKKSCSRLSQFSSTRLPRFSTAFGLMFGLRSLQSSGRL